MSLIAGASRFLNQATLSNSQGFAAQSSNILGVAASSVSVLDVGRSLAVQGVGISNRARQLNAQQINQTSGTYNQLFSTTAVSSSVENSLTQIRGLRAAVPASREVSSGGGTGNTPPSGSIVDETV